MLVQRALPVAQPLQPQSVQRRLKRVFKIRHGLNHFGVDGWPFGFRAAVAAGFDAAAYRRDGEPMMFYAFEFRSLV